MKFKLTIDIVYDDATVPDKVLLGRALMERIHTFIDDGNVLPIEGVVIGELEAGVEEVHE
jgi:hypothetical protein